MMQEINCAGAETGHGVNKGQPQGGSCPCVFLFLWQGAKTETLLISDFCDSGFPMHKKGVWQVTRPDACMIRNAENYCLFFFKSSTTAGSASVEVSPISSN